MTDDLQPIHQSYRITNKTTTDTLTLHSSVTLSDWNGPAPINYDDIREAFILALAGENISPDIIENVLSTVDQTIVENESQLQWEN